MFDQVRFINLRCGGNRVELIKHLPHADVREHLPEAEHHRTAQAPAVWKTPSLRSARCAPRNPSSFRAVSTAPVATATTGTTSTLHRPD
jgi:hypothetical protein